MSIVVTQYISKYANTCWSPFRVSENLILELKRLQKLQCHVIPVVFNLELLVAIDTETNFFFW